MELLENPTAFEEVTGIVETENAVLCEIDEEAYWIPKSCIFPESEVQEEGDFGILVIPEWLASKKELIGDPTH